MLRVHPSRIAALFLTVGIVSAALVGACADKKGALMLAINTDMKAPKDVNAVSVTISTNGAIKHSFIGRVTPQGEVTLPATLAIVEPEDKSASIRIRVMAFQDRKARVLRDVRTTVPSDGRTALLRIPLNFVNDASAVGEALPNGLVPDPIPGTGGTTGGGTSGGGTSGGGTSPGSGGGAADYDFFGAFQPPCPDIQNQTIIDGECRDNFVDPETLPDFEQSDLGDSTDQGSCFDVAKCLASAVGVGGDTTEPVHDAGAEASTTSDGSAPRTDAGDGSNDAGKFKDFVPAAVTFDRNACSLQLNGANPARLNLAIVTPDTGECVRQGECYIPIDRAASGWTEKDGRVQLPPFVCKLLNGKNLRLATSTETCAAKEEKNPICAAAKPGGPQDNTVCTEFTPGMPVGPGIGGSVASLVTAQGIADYAGSASVGVDRVTDACRKIAQGLNAPPEQQAQADQTPDKDTKVKAWCALATSAIATTKAQAGGNFIVNGKPAVCHELVSVKAACQAQCAGAPCDIKANPPICTGGNLIVECKGQCSSSAGAPLQCEGACTGSCNGSCVAPNGVECSGTCAGTCTASEGGSGTQPDGTCRGSCKGTCGTTAPGALCAGACNGDCSGSCNATADAPAKCNGQCSADFQPLYCAGGKLEGGCRVDAKCDAGCDLSVIARAECIVPPLTFATVGAADQAAAGRLGETLSANLPVLLGARAQLEVMASMVASLSGNAASLVDIKASCVLLVTKATITAQNDVAAALTSAASVTGSVGAQ